ncbi:MAG: hypothetical protein AB7F40_08750 [Victivallaceae bacterium]
MSLLLAEVPAFAAYQYNGPADYGNSGVYFTFTGAGKTYLAFQSVGVRTESFFFGLFSDPIVGLDSTAGFTDWGYYSMAAPGMLVSAAADGYIGAFDSEDAIGIWLRNADGTVYTSTNTKLADRIFGGSGQSDGKFCIYDQDGFTCDPLGLLPASHYEYSLMTLGNPPAGQPLPGILAGLVVSCGCGMALMRRRRK